MCLMEKLELLVAITNVLNEALNWYKELTHDRKEEK